jgi:hypothetical protein
MSRADADLTQQQNAGWYPVPDATDRLRYFDGTGWTEHYAPRQSALPPPVATTLPPLSGLSPTRVWWKRKRVWIPAALLLLLVGAASASSKPKTNVKAAGSTTPPTAVVAGASVANTTVPLSSTAASAATTAAPLPTTTLPATVTPTTLAPTTVVPTTLPPAKIYDGSGDDVIDISYPAGDKAGALFATYQGESNFIVTGLKSGERVSGLVNVIGHYEGSVTVDSADQLQIKASGPWHLEIRSLLSLPTFDKHAEGHGDAVLIFNGARGVMAASHDGTSNFIVHSIGKGGRNGLINEIGVYKGKVPLAAGSSFISIHADGNWTLDVG